MPIQRVPLEKSYRLLNHGPTAMISAKHEGVTNAMSAAWVCALDFAPQKVTMFKEGHWLFEQAPEEMKTLHYIAGGSSIPLGLV